MNNIDCWTVTDVKTEDDYKLLVTFKDGKTKIFDMKPWLKIPYFEKLKNPGFFKQARVENFTVAWPDEIDIDPETLCYDGIELEK